MPGKRTLSTDAAWMIVDDVEDDDTEILTISRGMSGKTGVTHFQKELFEAKVGIFDLKLHEKDHLIDISLHLWRIAKDALEDDKTLLFALGAFARSVIQDVQGVLREKNGDPPVASMGKHELLQEMEKLKDKRERVNMAARIMGMTSILRTPQGCLLFLHLARWANYGFPQICMGHKFCAALLMTGMGESALDVVRPPWPNFVIEVPNELLSVRDTEANVDRPIRRILVGCSKDEGEPLLWSFLAVTDTPLNLWRFGVETKELLPAEVEGDEAYASFDRQLTGSQDMLDTDRRVLQLIGRLIINVCLAMSDPSSLKEVGPGHKRYAASGSNRKEPEPIVRTFQVGKPVKIDLRETIATFIKQGARKMPSTQVLVRGFWRMQPHGPKSSLRRPQFIEPFWRGAEDAPIAIRPHVLDRKEPVP